MQKFKKKTTAYFILAFAWINRLNIVMKKTMFIFLFIIYASSSLSQNHTLPPTPTSNTNSVSEEEVLPQNTKKSIETEELKKWLNFFAQPKWKGRLTGSEEEKMYTQMIHDRWKKQSLRVNKQSFPFFAMPELAKNPVLKLKFKNIESELKLKEDFQVLSSSASTQVDWLEVVFAGFGIVAKGTQKYASYNSYQSVDVKGKWALAFRGVPDDVAKDYKSYLQMYGRIQDKVRFAQERGAQGLILVNSSNQFLGNSGGLSIEASSLQSPILVVELKKASLEKAINRPLEFLLTQLNNGEKVSLDLSSLQARAEISLKSTTARGINIIGELTQIPHKPYLLISAHGDHLGMGQMGGSFAPIDQQNKVHPGADDNASGMAVVMELVEFFAKSKSLSKVNLIFAIWSGEEVGLLGSRYYFSQNKKRMAAHINMDMVGRLKDKVYIQGVGSHDGWNYHLQKTSQLTPTLSYELQSEALQSTDSLVSYEMGLPVLNFFTGSHLQYHTPVDRPESINYEGLQQIAVFIKNLIESIDKENHLTQNKAKLTKKVLAK